MHPLDTSEQHGAIFSPFNAQVSGSVNPCKSLIARHKPPSYIALYMFIPMFANLYIDDFPIPYFLREKSGRPWPGTFCGPLLLRLVPKDASPGLQRPRGRGRRSQGDQHRVFQVADLRPRFPQEEFTQNIREQNPKQSETIGDFFRILGMKKVGTLKFQS